MADEDAEREVEDAVGWLVDDLADPGRRELLTEAQLAACLAWMLRWRVTVEGLPGWIESHGPLTAAAAQGLRLLKADAHAELLDRVLRAVPHLADEVAQTRLEGADLPTLRSVEESFFALNRRTDLVVDYVAPFVASHPKDFPKTVDDLE